MAHLPSFLLLCQETYDSNDVDTRFTEQGTSVPLICNLCNSISYFSVPTGMEGALCASKVELLRDRYGNHLFLVDHGNVLIY